MLISSAQKMPSIERRISIEFRDPAKCRTEIAASLNDLSSRWCKRKNVEPDALKEWKLNIFKFFDIHISFYSSNTHPLNLKLIFVSRMFI